MAGSVDILAQLPQLESLCERLYNSQASTQSPFFHLASDHINASIWSALDLLLIVFICLFNILTITTSAGCVRKSPC